MTHDELIILLRRERTSRRLGIREISQIAGCSKNTYNAFELGRGNLPTSTLLDILHYYDLDIHIVKNTKTTQQ